MPATHGRPTSKPPTGRYRRRMRQRLTKHYGSYGQRWQVETGISMLKRRVSSLVQARTYWNQCRELLLIALTYNLMLLYAAAAFLPSRCVPFVFSLCFLCFRLAALGTKRVLAEKHQPQLAPRPSVASFVGRAAIGVRREAAWAGLVTGGRFGMGAIS
jgi:hypothetical protein